MQSSALGVDHQSALRTALTPDSACGGSAAKRCTQDRQSGAHRGRHLPLSGGRGKADLRAQCSVAIL